MSQVVLRTFNHWGKLMSRCWLAIVCVVLLPFVARALDEPKAPATVKGLFADFDPRKDPLVIVLTENFFRSYRGKQKEFVAVVKLTGGKAMQTVSLEPKDFKTSDGEALASWQSVDVLSLRAYYDKGGKLLGSKSWVGTQPAFRKLWWQGS
jgi:hypothetical protein